ncbi:MAG: sensor histidine kinase [Bacteroidales bacterium]|jgi:signal transduction histidine kinase|nr:sensor histidine kinase [Bacteroidales bacterium]
MDLRHLKWYLLILLITSSASLTSGRNPVAEKGVLDLREYKSDREFIVRLDGEWEFYWGKMLHPYDFTLGKTPTPDLYGRVPSYWTNYQNDSLSIQKMGFATYRLVLLMPEGMSQRMAFDVPVFDSSYDLFVNGVYLGSNGVPGKTAGETVPQYKRNFFSIDPSSDSLSILINVSNFHHRRGGFWLPLRIGTFEKVRRTVSGEWAGEWATISLLMGFSLLFLFFYLMYRKDKLMGFFSLATIGLAIRPLFTSHFLILDITDLKWIWIVRLEYLVLYYILITWFWYIANLYPGKNIKRTSWIVTAIFSVSAVFTLFLPVRIFSYFSFPAFASMILLIGYAMSRNIKGMISGKTADYIYFFAFLMLSLGAIHDMFVALGRPLISSGYILTFVLVIFVIIQASLLLYKWVSAFDEKEKLHNDLEYMNRNLEMLVNERTQEIQSRREEIENQNRRIALQNRQMSETIQLKNKIFSVIAHDLRSPVVNILYMLNLLKEDENRDKYDLYANASIQYAQQVITLLENMLVWGRGQEEKIKYSPGHHDIADLILTNLSIFKESADKKEITVNFTQIGRSMAYFDKDLLDIIIRNLLSNAIKYTPRGGRISIVMKDRSQTGDGFLIKVSDNGVGIPPLRQKYLFTMSEMESTPGTENEKGTGIGLKLCHELIKINKGTIAVESKEGEGTCFSISIPGPG